MKTWKTYSPFEWVMIDVASRYGHDKEEFSWRIDWVAKNVLPLVKVATEYNMFTLLMKPFIDTADEKPMFCGALLALWDALQGKESTWQVGQDAASSGPALLSLLLKDPIGMRNCGVIGLKVPDVYTTVTDTMGIAHITRKIVKKGIVPHIYASEQEPKRVFKKDYPTFLKAYRTCLPKAQEASDFMVQAWNPHTDEHVFPMPDGAVVRIPVLVKKQKTLPCGKHSFEYIYEELGTKKKGDNGTKSLSANTTHGYDGYILRELNRRCNYNVDLVENAQFLLYQEPPEELVDIDPNHPALHLEKLYFQFNQLSIVVLEYLDADVVAYLSEEYKEAIRNTLIHMRANNPFEISNIHDEFKTLPKDVTSMKHKYNQLMAETYESLWWYKTAELLSGKELTFMITPADSNLVSEILDASYSIG